MALDTSDRRRTDDPQITVRSTVKETSKGEMLVFQFDLGLFQIVCLANIPDDGEESAPVYVKFKVGRPRKGNRAPETDDSEG